MVIVATAGIWSRAGLDFGDAAVHSLGSSIASSRALATFLGVIPTSRIAVEPRRNEHFLHRRFENTECVAFIDGAPAPVSGTHVRSAIDRRCASAHKEIFSCSRVIVASVSVLPDGRIAC